MRRPTVAIVGRPNVGKSSIFNRLLGRKKALVQDRPGVTRDRNYAVAELRGRELLLCDTGGFEEVGVVADDVLARLIREQALVAVDEADVVLMVMDVREGLVATDLDIARRMRACGKPVIWVLNKADSKRALDGEADFYRLGVDDWVAVSAEHGLGFEELVDRVVALLPAAREGEPAQPEPWDERRRRPRRREGQGSRDRGGRLYFFGDDMPAAPTTEAGPGPEPWDPQPPRRTAEVGGDEDDEGAPLEEGRPIDEDGRPLRALVAESQLASTGWQAEAGEGEAPEFARAEDADFVPRICILGRPNVGKSTLLNRLLGYQRSITSPVAGTTHDAVDAFLELDGRRWILIDTAGIRRRSRVVDGVEKLTVGRALRSIEAAHVCVLVVDAAEGVTEQEARIGSLVADRGRALLVVVNKWDQKPRGEAARRDFMDGLRRRFPHLAWADVLFLSALTGRGMQGFWKTVERANEGHRMVVRTGPLNRWAGALFRVHPPPQHKNHPVRLYYCAQTGTRPPSFVLFCNQPQAIPESYRRFLENQLRASFPAHGSPIRLQFRDRAGAAGDGT